MSARAGSASPVVITGIGLVTPLGVGTRESWEALLEGRSGVGRLERFDMPGLKVGAAGEVRDFDPAVFLAPPRQRHLDRFAQMAVAAARMALGQAGFGGPGGALLPARTAVVIGVGLGGLETVERMHAVLNEKGPRFVTPYLIPMIIPNMAAAWVSMLEGARGPTVTVATACASGAHALGEAMLMLRQHRVDLAIAGGAEAAITPLGVAGFHAMRALSTRDCPPAEASCPFDERRDGFVMGEGAGVMVLERSANARERGARAIARIAGYGASSDAFDPTQPDPQGRGALAAMRIALEDAGMEPTDVGYVNAHATSTPLGDRVEANAIRALLGERAHEVPVSSTKGATGHMLGAAGAVGAAFTALAIQGGVVPCTLNLRTPDRECDLDHVIGKARRCTVRAALGNAFGFGGTNATLVLAGAQE